ncbi:MAG TPA: ABC transporter permease [Vicinamibacterales bacterium]|nr:ABC transporter permease [Vicinamibacterales bacterium]
MKHLLTVLLRVGRSDDERVSLLGDIEEERRARLARGSSRLAVFAWSTAEISRALLWGLRDALVRRAFAPRARFMLSWPDIKLSLRLLIRNPGLTAVSTVGIAVGIAIAAGMFGFFHANFDPTLPLEEGDRIVALENWDVAGNNENRRSLHDFVTWRDQMTSVVEISAFRETGATMRAGDFLPENVRIAAMSASGFRVARVPALVGRFLTPDDEREAAPPVVVIGYDVWQSRFGQDRGVIGQQVRLGSTQFTVVGVMPDGFAFPVNHQYWIPLRVSPSTIARGAGPELFVFGRLAPGATMASAQVELSVIGQRAAAAFPQTNATLKPQVLGYTRPIIDNQDMGLDAWVMGQLTVSLVLVIVALNVAILLYARTATRRGEIAVRTALGASRARIVTQLFVEALVLAVVPAVLGLALAQYGLELGNRLMFLDLVGGAAPFWLEQGPQPSTMLYVLVLVVVTAAIAGILPALHATRRRGGADLRQLGGSTGPRLGRMWSALIVAQVAFAVAALPAAIKLGLNEIRSSLTRPNYPVEEFVGAAVLTEIGSSAFGNRLLELRRRLQAEPDVTGVTFTGSLPQRNITGRIEVEGTSAEGAAATNGMRGVTTFGIDTEYLDVYGLRVVAGRPFNALDASATDGPVIVDISFAQRFLNGTSPVGRRMRYAARPNGQPSPWYEIVGVAENLRRNPIDPDIVGPTVLYPVAPEQLAGVSLTVRLRGSAASRMNEGFARTAHQILAAVDPALRMAELRARDQAESEDALAVRLVGLVLSCILLTVLLFSAAGVYSLMSFTVAQRRREIGIRTALGASSMDVLRSVFSRVAAQVGMGVVLGAVGAMAIAPLSNVVLAGRLAMVTPAIALTMVVVGVVAAYGPARRSLRIPPTEAVRAE